MYSILRNLAYLFIYLFSSIGNETTDEYLNFNYTLVSHTYLRDRNLIHAVINDVHEFEDFIFTLQPQDLRDFTTFVGTIEDSFFENNSLLILNPGMDRRDFARTIVSVSSSGLVIFSAPLFFPSDDFRTADFQSFLLVIEIEGRLEEENITLIWR